MLLNIFIPDSTKEHLHAAGCRKHRATQRMSKRKLPHTNCNDQADLDQALIAAAIQEGITTPPRRVAPKGSPADEFLTGTMDAPSSPSQEMTCDLSAVPTISHNKKRTLSAIIIGVLPVYTKGLTVRRNVILRDEVGECVVCVWANHTTLIHEGCIGRPVTFNRVSIKEHEGNLQLSMPKDSTVAMGATPKTNKIQAWLSVVGQTPISVVEAISLKTTTITCIHGMLAKVSTETVTLKTGIERALTTLALAAGPPKAFLYIQFWNVANEHAKQWEEMLHLAVNVNKVRCTADGERGNTFESIGDVSTVVRNTDTSLEDWWFTKAV